MGACAARSAACCVSMYLERSKWMSSRGVSQGLERRRRAKGGCDGRLTAQGVRMWVRGAGADGCEGRCGA
eukprot:scaffold54569_cov45-Phaeocystis_antarctica.AAC.2